MPDPDRAGFDLELDRAEFDVELARRLGLPELAALPGTTTLGELSLDSLNRLELSVWLAEVGAVPDEGDVDPGRTVDELYEVYRSAVRGDRPATPAEDATFTENATPTETGDEPRPPARRSPHFDLAPVSRDMLPYLYQLAISTETGYRWRFRGAVPTYETFEATFWQGALVQFIAVERLSGSPAGHLVCYNPEHGHGYAYIGAVFDTEYVGSGAAVGAVRHFVDYVFTTWAFRKLYMETPAFNYDQFASGEGRYFDVEGRLLNHDYYAGRYWDRLILAVYRRHAGLAPIAQ